MITKHLKSVSAVFPAYNDSWVICEQIAKAYEILPQITKDYEVIVVNDGSHDDTAELLNEAQKKYPNLKVIVHPENRGYGAAVTTGLMAASKEWVFYTDGDGQYEVYDLKLLVKRLSDNVDVVNGYKLNRAEGGMRLIVGKTYGHVIRFLFRLPIRDVDCDFRLIRKDVLKKFMLNQETGSFCVELVKKLHLARARFVEVPVRHYPRKYGSSQFFAFRPVAFTLLSLYTLWTTLVLNPHLVRMLPRFYKSWLVLYSIIC